MRKALMILAAASLSACSATTQQPVATASTKAVIAGDESYRAASQFGAALVAAGKLDKPTFQDLDRKAYTALIVLRSAQAGGTAADVTTATTNLGIAVAAIYALKGQ